MLCSNDINLNDCMCNTEALPSLSLGDQIDLQLRANFNSSPLLANTVNMSWL